MAVEQDQKGAYIFVCEVCGEIFETGKLDWKEALQVYLDEAEGIDGWQSEKDDREDSKWEHYCNDCKDEIF